MPTTESRAGVVSPSSGARASPSVETSTVEPAARAEAVEHDERLAARAAVGLEPLREQQAAALERRVLAPWP